MTFIANARMYAVSPAAETAWRKLLEHIAEAADVELDYRTYPAPQPLEDLWRRPDVGCVQMCGYPIAMCVADVVPLAAPVPAAAWAEGRAVYRSDLIVRADAPYRTLADTFEGTVGWTVSHSHSGFNALRYHLLSHRAAGHSRVYRHAKGNLITARRIIDSVLDGTIDVGPLDAYWHMLIRKHDPELMAGVRVLEATATAPMPAFVASPNLPASSVTRLRAAFQAAHHQPWFDMARRELLVERFEPVTIETYAPTLRWKEAAESAGYLEPA